MLIARRARRLAWAGLLFATIFASGGHGAWAVTTPPAQPKSGPGGADNPGAEIVKRAIGTASNATFVYYAAGGGTEPRPVVILLHAWGAINPLVYGGWIDHLARRGYIVLFPAFQEIGKTRPPDATARVATRVKAALADLAAGADAKPDLDRVAVLGHSAGAGLAINFAAQAKADDLPVPKLVFLLMPGGVASDEKSRGVQILDLSQLDPATNLIAMVGDREAQASERISRRLLRESTSVPQTRKLFVRVGSDDHGFPALSATLASPASPLSAYDSAAIVLSPDPPRDRRAPAEPRPRWSADMVLSGEQTVLVAQLSRNVTDTLDYLAFWRSFDMAADAAFAGKEAASLQKDETFADMGRWSDTWPVRRLAVEVPRAVDPARAVSKAPPATTSKVTAAKAKGRGKRR